jgi:type I restriction enzyme S subunit
MATAEQLITEHLDTWTSAIKAKSSAGRGGGKKSEFYGIKKLRELILELAVRGLLVPQDSSDEPASELLKRIAQEKAKLVEAGTIKAEKGLAKIGPEERATEVPSGWDWCRLGNITLIVRGITFPASEKSKTPEAGRIACLRTSNVQDQIEWDDLLFIRESFAKRDDQIVLKDDIVMSMANSRELVGKVAIIQTTPAHKTTFGGFLGVIRPIVVAPHFVMILLRSPRVKEAMIGSASQTTNIANVSLGKLKPLALPLPPLAEQHRIVAKVDELMALCDQLEQQQTDSIAAHETLVSALLRALTSLSEQRQFESAWQRIAANFDRLFTTESSIDQLKQTILQLAVMGKLIPQDPNDESAAELLKKIAAEKSKFIKEGKIRKQKALPAISEDDKQFDLPANWKWGKIRDIAQIKGGFAYKSKDFVPEGTSQVIRMGNVRPNYLRLDSNPVYIPSEIAKKTTEYELANGDILLTMTGTKGKRDYLYSLTVLNEHTTNKSLYLNQRLCSIQCSRLNIEYIAITLKDDRLLDSIYSKSTGTANQANIGMEAISNWALPLPPLAEQHRIVAKVDELMSLCDALKAKLKAAQSIQLNLADCLVEQAIG